MADFTKATFNLPTDDLEALKEIAKRKNTSVTNILRRAIDLELYLEKKGGSDVKVLLQDPSGSIREIVRT